MAIPCRDAMKNKRGSHIGFVLSFVIFIVAIVYLYTILKPAIEVDNHNEYLFNSLKENLINISSEEITTLTIQLDGIFPTSENCISINNILDEIIISDLIIKNGEGNLHDYEILGSSLEVEVGVGFEGILKVYYSDSLGNNSITGLEDCQSMNSYSIDLIQTDKYNYEESVTDILEDYINDYEGLKTELGVPSYTEFDLAFIYNNGTRIETGKELPTLGEIFVKTIPIKYIDADANLNMGFLEISLWE